MLRLKKIAVPLFLSVLAGVARAADPATAASVVPPASEIGAKTALKYWQAFAAMPATDADITTAGNWQTDPLDQRTTEFLKRSEAALRYLHAGAAFPQCDWSLDYSDGPMLLLPHIVKCRELGRIACLRMRYELQQHQYAAAVVDAGDVLALARHTGRDPILICVLVRYSMEQWVIDALAPHLRELDAKSLQQLQDRLAHLPDAPTLADVLRLEPEFTVQWSIRKIQAAGDHPDWSEIFPPELYASDTPGQVLGGTVAEAMARLQELAACYEECGKLLVLNQEEFHAKFAELMAKYQANPLVKASLSPYGKAFDGQASAMARFALLQAAVAVVVPGGKGADAVKGLVDPVNHEPFEYKATAGGNGFELTAAVMYMGRPVMVTVGSGQAATK